MTSKKNWWFWLTVALLFFVFLYLIRAILLPFVLGIFTAYFLDPATDRLEKTGLSRGVSTLVITACFFVSIVILSILVIPVIASQLSGLIEALPEYIGMFNQHYSPIVSRWIGELPADQVESVKSATSNVSGMLMNMLGGFVTGLFASGMAIINALSLILITPVVAFYLLRDWDELTARIDKLLPRAHAPVIRQQLAIINNTLAGFIHGQLNVCLILGLYYAIGLSLVGLKFGIVIGLAAGLLVIFPYVGVMLSMAVGLGIAFFQFDNMSDVLMVLGVFVTGQVVEGYFITPKLVGEKVGLHPVWIIFGMLAGATLFGFVGILLAVPTTAVLGVLLRFAFDRYLHSSYYAGDTKVIAPKP